MKKIISILLAAALAVCGCACAREEPEEIIDDDMPKEPVYATYEGEGWSFEYDPELFENSGDMTVTYIGEGSPMPVYLAVQEYPEYTARELADGLVLQSGSDDVKVESAHVGKDKLAAMSVYIEREVGESGEVIQYQRFYAVDVEPGCVLLEAGSYDGAPGAATEGLEAMLDSFVLK